MNPNRNTNHFTPLSYLNWIQRGGTTEWKHLYALCKDAAVAKTVAAVLAQRDRDLMASARLWKYLLEDLHPGIHVDLRPDHRDTGV